MKKSYLNLFVLFSLFSVVCQPEAWALERQLGQLGQLGQQKDNPVSDFLFTFIPEEKAHAISGSAQQEELAPYSIKALIWNIKKSQVEGWEREFLDYSHDQDLVLIQEAYDSEYFKNVLSDFQGYRWDMGVSFLYRRYGNTATGTMIGSKTRPSWVMVKHSVDREPITETPKSMTFAKYPLSGTDKELLAINVHGINLTTYSSFVRQMAQASEEIEKHSGPVLFAGDFNTRTNGRLNYLKSLAERLRLEEVKFKHAEYRMVWRFTDNYLDHAFVKGLRILNAEVLKDSLGSDHKPMVLEAEYQPSAPLPLKSNQHARPAARSVGLAGF